MLYTTLMLASGFVFGIGAHKYFALRTTPRMDKLAYTYLLETLTIEETAERVCFADEGEESEANLWLVRFARNQLIRTVNVR